MDDAENIWINHPKYSQEYISGIKAFVQNAFPKLAVGDEMTCPCKNCKNVKWHRQDLIYNHLICNGPSPLYVNWIVEVSRPNYGSIDKDMDCETNINFGDDLDEMFHRTNGPNTDAKIFYRHLEEGRQPLYPGCKKFSRLSFIVRLYSLKCVHGITESGFGDILELIKDAFPEAHIPLSFNAAKNVIKDLGLDYKKIHACPNNCMLYWGENENEEECKTCGLSRWVVVEKEGTSDNPKKLIHKVPANVMRYFPLRPRLQRLFMCKEFSELMVWHAVGRKMDGKLRHPADAEAWKTMDARYPHFSSENRNIRLGVAADGFNPFRTMNTVHTTWPIILVNYNLPPWLCMKPENLILSTLISGPDSPKNNIDVFMQPLMAELRELWNEGVETYDAFTGQTFTLRASVLWTISDFPGYAMLSGWSTKGYLACPVCNYETSSMYLKHSRKMCYMNHRKFLDPEHKWRLDKRRFNGQIEMGQPPEILSGTDIEELLSNFVNQFGKKKEEPGRKKVKNINTPFKKKSIFFTLPMEKFINLRFHHQGEFQSTQYAGGKVYDMKGIDLDTFSYAVLMEYVKDDLRYSEIGGIYVSKDEMGGWKLLSTDSDLSPLVERVDSGDYIDFYVDNVVDNNIEPMKQMQPHVVIRPRHSLLAAKKQVKRKFVTTHQLQQQQKNKKTMELGKTVTRSTQKLPQGGSRKSPRLNNQHEISDATASHKSATARRKLDLDNPSHEDENTGENDVEACYLPPPPALTEYENQRAVRIKMNNEVYFALNLPTLSSELRNSAQRNKGKEKMQERSEDYDPGQEDGSEGDAVESPLKRTKNKKKVDKKKVLMGRGPTTRSRGNDASKKPANEDGSKKQETRGPVQLAEFAEPCIELPKSDEGNGSMAAFWAMRKRQKEKDEKEKAEKVAATATESKMVVEDPISPNIEGGEAVEVPKRLRGKTRMEKVHTRSLDKRIVVRVNELFQPIADDDRVRTELGNFLGTLAKRCVSLTYVTWRHVPENLKKTMWNYVKHRYIIPDECEKWVEKTIQASWRRYKSTIKKAHYKAFENDEERLENRPEEIPLESFKMLLEYWNDETIQSKARTNSASRKNYVDTHTAGPKSFAQIRNKMTKEMKEKLKEKMKEQSATSDAEDCDADVCDAQVFVETRKRTDGRKYQANPAIMKSKIEKIKKKLSSGDAYDELVSDGKSHDPTWLLGRCPKPSKGSSSCAPTDTYVQQLTNRIRQSLADEVEEKMTKKVQAEVYEQVNKKVQQNLAWILKKLGEANPNITVDIDQLGAIISSDNDDVTPMTGGTSF